MEDKRFSKTSDHHRESGERKCHPNAHREVKRKLSFINKKIGDLQRQRKFTYKNSAKVKKVVHYQVNQIVKCLRARERSLWADVDEAYLSQDENISNELSKLQSVHARCQAFFDHLDGNKGNIDVLDKIYSILSEINFGEKQDVKALEFISDFENMKSMANYFGHLDGDFIKKDEFIFIEKKDSNSSDIICEGFHDKKEDLEKSVPLTIVESEDSKNDFFGKFIESEDSFEIVDLLENMNCGEYDKDSIMVEQEKCESYKQQIKCIDYPSGNGNKLLKVSNSLENYQKALKSDDFNPDEEWRQISEMRKRIANFSGMTSTLLDENKSCEIQSIADNRLNADKCYGKNSMQNTLSSKGADNCLHVYRSSGKDKLYDKSYKQNKFLLHKEAHYWLDNRSLEKDALKARNFERINIGKNSDSSPAELIRQAFTSYLTKEGTENWLLCN